MARRHGIRAEKRHIAQLKKIHAHHKRAAGAFSKHFHAIIKDSRNFVTAKAHAAAKKMHSGAAQIKSKLLGAHAAARSVLHRGAVKVANLTRPKGMTKRGSGMWGPLNSAWNYVKGIFHKNKHHLHALKDKAISLAKDEAMKLKDEAMKGGKAYLQKHGKAIGDKVKGLAKSAKDKAISRAKEKADKYIKKGTAHVDKFVSGVTDKLNSAQNWVDKN